MSSTSTDSAVLVCPGCGTKNRVPRARFGDVPVCSTCKEQLLPEHPAELDEAGLDKMVAGSELPVLVDFWAPWCGPCRQMAPHFAAAVGKLSGRAVLAKVDTDQNQNVAERLGIRGIPTLILFVGGKEKARQSGAMDTGRIVAWVNSQL